MVRKAQEGKGKFIAKYYPDTRALQTQLNQWISQGYGIAIEYVQLVPPESGGGIFVILWREEPDPFE